MENLVDQYGGAELYFMLGIDAFLDIPHWWNPGKLLSLVNFALLSRPDSRFVDLQSSPYLNAGKDLLHRLDRGKLKTLRLRLETQREVVMVKVTDMAISSTDIRNRVREGKSVKYLLPGEVESFIISNRLYLMNKESERK
jgi:nicotinate-nucleotide adenylyltransferase